MSQNRYDFDRLNVFNTDEVKRSRLHSKDYNTWFKKRNIFSDQKVKNDILFLPESQKKNLEMEQIFSIIDTDGSGNLDSQEFYEMFKKNNFIFDHKDMDLFVSIADQDSDNQIALKEFQSCSQNQKVNKCKINFIITIFYYSQNDIKQFNINLPNAIFLNKIDTISFSMN